MSTGVNETESAIAIAFAIALCYSELCLLLITSLLLHIT